MSSLNELFTDIADAIRSRNGTEDKILATDFPEEILNLEAVNGEEIAIIPSTVKQVYTPSTGYNAITRVDVDAVTSSIDNNISPENIKKDVTILGITGILEEGAGGSGEIKLFATEEEMQSSTDNEEGDLAVVYSSVIANLAKGIPFSSVTFPATVTLPTKVTTSAYTYLRATDPNMWAEAQISLGSQYFDFNYYGDTGQTMVYYESTDGITYTKLDGPDTVELDTELVDNSSRWNDNFGYFMQVTTANFEGLFTYKAGVWGYAPNQINISDPNQLVPGVKAYGNKGIVEGDGSIYPKVITTIANYNYTSDDYNSRIYTENALTNDALYKYNFLTDGPDTLNITKKKPYTSVDGNTSYLQPTTGGNFITDGIMRGYGYDDDYIYACSSSNVHTIIRYDRKTGAVKLFPFTDSTIYLNFDKDSVIRFVYDGNVYVAAQTDAQSAATEGSGVVVEIQKYDLATGTTSIIYSELLSTGAFTGVTPIGREVVLTYTNGKFIIGLARAWRNSSSATAHNCRAYAYVYDMATNQKMTLQNGINPITDRTTIDTYSIRTMVNTDGKYAYFNYGVDNSLYEFKYDINTGAKIYGKPVDASMTTIRRTIKRFLYYNEDYALVNASSTGSYVDILKFDLNTATYSAVYSYTDYFSDTIGIAIDNKKIIVKNHFEIDINEGDLTVKPLENIDGNNLNSLFLSYKEKGVYKAYEGLYKSLYVANVINVTDDETVTYCDFYGTSKSSTSFITPQMLISDDYEKLLLADIYKDTITPEEYSIAVDTAAEILGEEVNE